MISVPVHTDLSKLPRAVASAAAGAPGVMLTLLPTAAQLWIRVGHPQQEEAQALFVPRLFCAEQHPWMALSKV